MADAVNHVVIGFSDPDQIRAGFARLDALVASAELDLVDVEFVHSIQGMPSTVPASRVAPDLAGYDHLDTAQLNQADLDAVADAIPVGSMAVVVLYRTTATTGGDPIAPPVAQWSGDGATVVGQGAGTSLGA